MPPIVRQLFRRIGLRRLVRSQSFYKGELKLYQFQTGAQLYQNATGLDSLA